MSAGELEQSVTTAPGDHPAAGPVAGLAAGWYVALASRDLGAKPRAVDLFSRRLVAWRDGAGRAVLMPRYCPHLSADLALAKVVDGCLRCVFHHWRFDGSGACVDVPGARRPPPGAGQPAYPVTERYGFVWAWYGGREPMFPLPDFPALEADRRQYLAYRFSNSTPASPRRILENAFDYYHFRTLHKVEADEPLQLTTLPEPEAAAQNGPPIAPEAWFGALLEAGGLKLPRALTALGIHGRQLSLLVDGWTGGQRLTFTLDGEVVAKELLGICPVDRHRTVFLGWSLVRRSGHAWRDGPAYGMYRAQHWLGTREDLRIYEHADDSSSAPVRYDQGVLRFRRYYQGWVERAEQAESRDGIRL
jgi:aminopyrrolnitrin oxygenase